MTERLFGVDIGGTGIKLGLVEFGERPRLLASRVVSGHAHRDPHEVLPEVAAALREIEASAGGPRARGVGVGSAGLIDRDRGVIAFSPNLPAWTGAPAAEILSRALSLPVRMDNDVNAFTLAECRWGAGAGARNVVFLTLGTGVGGGFLVDGRLVRGAAGFAGEPGHTTLVLDGTACACGNRGCAERYMGNQDIVEAARRHPGFAAESRLQDESPLTPEALSRAAEAGSAVARDVLAATGEALGGLLVSLVNLFNPERIVIGGGVAQAGTWILAPARLHLSRHSLVARFSSPEIRTASLGPEAGLLGAAGLLLEEA